MMGDTHYSQKPSADKEIYLIHHQGLLAKWGEDIRTLGWGSPESQKVRFTVLSEIGDFEGKSILDVGCGFGDFFHFISQRGKHLKNYLGVDINQDMVAIAKRRFPNAAFEVRDILEDSVEGSFDFVVASGIFGLETPNWEETVEKLLSRMYELSEIGVGVNFLSAFTTGKKPSDSHFADPTRILDFVLRALSNKVVLRHDYRPNDFTLYIYKPFA
jgi:SAM-dependent methyltransferase